MENIKNLNARMDEFIANEENVQALTSSGNLMEFKRVHLAVKFLVENQISLTNDNQIAELSFGAMENPDRTEKDEKSALRTIEAMVIGNLKAERDVQQWRASDDKKAKRAANKLIAQIDTVAGQIMPDYIANAYAVIKAGNKSAEIKNEEGEIVFDLDKFFAAVRKSASKPAVVNNLPTYERDVEAKFRKVVKENVVGFLSAFEYISKQEASAAVELAGAGKVQRLVNSDIRKLRRRNRPVDSKGDLLPSYLDYINDDGSFVQYEQFKNTPSWRVYGDVTEEDYKAYVLSRDFSQLVGILEQPLSSETLANEVPSFKIEKNGNELRIAEEVDYSDYAVGGYTELGDFAKEPVILPKKTYKLAKRVENETVEVSKLKGEHEKLAKNLKRVGAGVLAAAILATAIGLTVKQFTGDKEDTPIVQGPESDTTTPDEPVKPELPTYNNTEVKDNAEDIKNNPALEITPEVDNMGDNGTIKPNLPELPESGDTE